MIVGIDGPASSGKGTIAKEVAKRLNLINIDTGITYRCVALESLNRGVDLSDKEGLIKIAEEIEIELIPGEEVDRVLLGGKDVTDEIRSKEVTAIVSPVSSIPEVRIKMVDVQRKLAQRKKCYIRW